MLVYVVFGGSDTPYPTVPTVQRHVGVTTNLGLWEKNAIYGRNANVRPFGGCALSPESVYHGTKGRL